MLLNRHFLLPPENGFAQDANVPTKSYLYAVGKAKPEISLGGIRRSNSRSCLAI